MKRIRKLHFHEEANVHQAMGKLRISQSHEDEHNFTHGYELFRSYYGAPRGTKDRIRKHDHDIENQRAHTDISAYFSNNICRFIERL